MKKILKILILLFGLALIILGGFLLYQKYLTRFKTLSQFIPENAEYYLEIDLSDDDLQENITKNQGLKNYFFDYLTSQGISKNILELEKNSIIALLEIEPPENDTERNIIWLVENDNIHQIEPLLPTGYYFSTLSNNVAVITKDYDTLEAFRQRAKNIDLKKEPNKLVDYLHYPIRGFYQKNKLFNQDIFTQENNQNIAEIVKNINLNDQIKFGFNLNNKRLLFEINTGKLSDGEKPDVELFNYLPNLGYILAINQVNLSSLLDGILVQISGQSESPDPNKNLAEYLAVKYNFSWYELNNILNQPSLLILSNKINLNQQNYLDLNNYNYAFVLKQADQEQEKKLINLFKNILAFKNPVKKDKVLPDQTTITEIMADPGSINFTDEDNLHLYQSANINLIYSRLNQQLIIGNSKELIVNILHSYTQDKLVTINYSLDECGLGNKKPTLFFNPNLIESKFFKLTTQGFFNLDDRGINGCFKLE